jgi:hypothetical protein
MSGIQAALTGNISFPQNSAIPTISGTASAGNTLTANPGSWYGTAPISYSYQWQQNSSNISGETFSTYALDRTYLGATITVNITATNPVGSTGPVSSAATSAVTGAPINSVLPTISGTASYGSVLTVTNGTWTGYPASYSYSYQWYNSSVGAISGATASTYTLAATDVGFTVYAIVTANNGISPNGTAQTASTSAVTRIPYIVSGSSTITGSPYIGYTLTANAPTFGGYPTPTVSYQWWNSSGIISGATASTYVVQVSDNATTIYVVIAATNSQGSVSSQSPATASVTYPPVYADLLVVGGGGGGAGGGLAGGGGGGVIYQPDSTHVLQRGVSYNIQVGGGGAGGPSGGANGSTSCFGAPPVNPYGSFLGCGGGGGQIFCGCNGGSGGGTRGLNAAPGSGKCQYVSANCGGNGTPGQGNPGGWGNALPGYFIPGLAPAPSTSYPCQRPAGGGGGGAGSAGMSASSGGCNLFSPSPICTIGFIWGAGGCGGQAANYSITGNSCDYAGGGGGASTQSAFGCPAGPCNCSFKVAGGKGGGCSGGNGGPSSNRPCLCGYSTPGFSPDPCGSPNSPWNSTCAPCGGTPVGYIPAQNGVACSGGGGGGNNASASCSSGSGCNGGPGVVVVAWCTTPAITYAVGPGITYCADTATRTGYTVLNFRGGSGTLCFGP